MAKPNTNDISKLKSILRKQDLSKTSNTATKSTNVPTKTNCIFCNKVRSLFIRK